jgi:hypothetical protein
MLRGPSLLSFYEDAVASEVGNILTKIFGMMIPTILIIVIVAAIFEIVKQVRQMIKKETLVFVRK